LKEEGTGHWNSPNTGTTNESSFTADGYDDVFYNAGAESGDLNLDGVDDVINVVMLVNNILNP